MQNACVEVGTKNPLTWFTKRSLMNTIDLDSPVTYSNITFTTFASISSPGFQKTLRDI